MNVAGKSLQDIYDAGSKRLFELEDAQKKQLGETADAHLEARKEAEPEAEKQLRQRCDELGGEIHAYLAQGLDRVVKVVGGETLQTQRYIQRLVNSLDLLAKRFSESVAQLRDDAETQLTDLSADNNHLYEAAGAAAGGRLKQAGTQMVDECRDEGCQSHGDLLGCADDAWQSILEQEDEVVADVLSNFDRNAEQLNAKSDECKKSIDADVTAKMSKLELRSLEATEAVRSTVDRAIEAADRHAFDADVRLKERFSSLLYETISSFEESSQRAITDVSNLHESSMADLTMRSQELSREMDGVVADIVRGAGDRLTELQQAGNNLISNYTKELDQRRESSEQFRDELEKERSEMVGRIWKELSEVKEAFQNKLTALAKSTLDKMRVVCDESEAALIAAQNSCASESKEYAGDKQKSIEQLASDFLSRVSAVRDQSLDAIAKAAGAGSEDPKSAALNDAEASGRGEDSGEDAEENNEVGTENRRRRRPGRQNDKRGDGKK